MSEAIKSLSIITSTIANYCGHESEELVKQLGSSYDVGRDVKDIAKDVRVIIKKAVKAGYLPSSLKVGVKISRASMCASIDITIKECDDCLLNVDAWRIQEAGGYMESWVDVGGRYSDKGKQTIEFLKTVLGAFQKSESHAQSDYHNTNFFSGVEISRELKDAQKSQFVETIKD